MCLGFQFRKIIGWRFSLTVMVPKKQKPPGRKAEGAGERDVSALALHKEQQSPVDHDAKGSRVLRICHVRIRLAAGGPRYADRQHD